MTGPEHYAEAERLLAEFGDGKSHSWIITPPILTRATIHAYLANAAATALAHMREDGYALPADRRAWLRAASEQPAADRRLQEARTEEAMEYAQLEWETPE